MTKHALLPLLAPRSIAVLGASSDPNKFSGRILPCLLRHGYNGALYPINAKQREVMGVRAYPDLDSIRATVDCVVFSIGAAGIGTALEACERKGVRLLVVTSAGFAERGDDEGRRLQQKLTDFARRTRTRVIGPNCIGFFNPVDATAVAAAAVLEWTELRAGDVGLVSQSGGLAFGTMLIGAHEKGIGFSRVVTTGNEADTDLVEWAEALLDDEHTHALALAIEGIRDGAAFQRFLARARNLRKPVVILKTGRTSLGETMAKSHTGSIAGSQAVFEAVCEQYGAAVVTDIDELYEIAAMFAKLRQAGKLATLHERPRRTRAACAALSISGGHVALFADLGSEAGLRFAKLMTSTQTALSELLKRPAPILNPVDLTGGTVSDPGLWGRCVRALLRDDNVDIAVPIPTIAKNYDPVMRDLIGIAHESNKCVIIAWPGSAREGQGKALVRDSLVPIFDSERSAARGAAALSAFWSTDTIVQAPAVTTVPQSSREVRTSLERLAESRAMAGERESKPLLHAIGFPVPREAMTASVSEAVSAATDIGYPVVLKGIDPDIAHKSDAGLVRLDLRTRDQVESAFESITRAMGGDLTNSHGSAGVLVQEMVAGGVELLLGVRKDPAFGPVLVFGLGGLYVEIFKDVAVRPAPVTRAQARSMMEEISGIALLKGARGRRPADLDAIASLLVALGDFAVANTDLVREVEINPLIVTQARENPLRAVDALIVFEPR